MGCVKGMSDVKREEGIVVFIDVRDTRVRHRHFLVRFRIVALLRLAVSDGTEYWLTDYRRSPAVLRRACSADFFF